MGLYLRVDDGPSEVVPVEPDGGGVERDEDGDATVLARGARHDVHRPVGVVVAVATVGAL